MLDEIPSQIGKYFNEEAPLGPVSAEYITDREVSAYLISLENAACLELAHGASIVIGRKGAGKSSILNSFKLRRSIKSHRALSITPPKNYNELQNASDFSREYDIICYVNFSQIAGHVHTELEQKGLKTPEAAAELWSEVLWELIFWESLRRPDLISRTGGRLSEELRDLSIKFSDYADLEYRPSKVRDWSFVEDISLKKLATVVDRVKAAFKKRDFKILFLIDSMEEYNQYDYTLMKCVAGLLQFIATEPPPLYFKLALPEENFLRFRRESNLEKFTLKTARVRWRPIELLDVLTWRMLICLHQFEPSIWEQRYKEYSNGNDSRITLMKFWADVFGGEIQNEALNSEPGIYYVLRHTQLLPRQVINAVSILVNESQTELHSYGRISHSVIRSCMESSSQALVSGVDSGFKDAYPEAITAFERFLPKCPIVARYNELHVLFTQCGIKGKSSGEYTRDIHSFIAALLHMGVLGVVEKESTSDRYIEAIFSYSDALQHSYDESTLFAMHPAFSLRYKSADSRAFERRAVLPRGSLDALDD